MRDEISETCSVSGNPLRSIPETTQNLEYRVINNSYVLKKIFRIKITFRKNLSSFKVFFLTEQ